MDPRVVPPEEKLLQLIRGKRGRSSPAAAQPPSTAQAAPSSSPAKPWRGFGWSWPSWSLTALNLGLGGVIVAEVIALVLLATRPLPAVSISLPPAHAMTPSPEAPATESTEPAPSLVAAGSRLLFQSFAGPGDRSSHAAAPSSVSAKAVAARLSLIGVVTGTPPQAIIQDAETNKTYFVSVGQAVVEGFVVEEIRDGGVVLALNGEKIELSL